ncbi:MAG TPA: DNA alkylation repair protein [Pyrinomonadaceae bacterium]|nr:DNA alkylation repair protein [Pyrinomonadaceae bacterium]
MPTKQAHGRDTRATPKKEQPLQAQVDSVIASLKRLSSKKTRDGMARYGLPSDKAFGVGVGQMQQLAKRLGPNHELAEALWKTGWYEARMMAAFLGEPERVTPGQMDRWCRDFDNWGIVDTVCFKLWDKSPHAFHKVEQWATRKDEFQKRAAFALLASLCAHDKQATDEQFRKCLTLIEKAADDDRNFVKKGVSWALRVIGRRSPELNKAAIELGQRLMNSSAPSAKWLGKEALKELTSAVVTRQLQARSDAKLKRKGSK